MWGFFESRPESDPSVLTFLDFNENLETNVPGVYVCGDITGYPLLKISINQAHDLVMRLAGRKPPPSEDVFDLVIVGAGAAGLSAAKTAKEQGLSHVLLEGATVAATVANFHKGKILFAEPEGEPVRGPLWFEECTREEILEKWRRDLESAGLNIETGVKVDHVGRGADGVFTVRGKNGRTFRGMRVILAVGRQGDPRKLGAPGEDGGHVIYMLYDPGKYRNQNIVVVGAGDQAAESVLALCDNNRVIMAVRGPELARPRKRNIQKLHGKAARGEIQILFETQIKEIKPGTVVLTSPEGERETPCDQVIVNAGSLPPYPFLKKTGVRMADAWTLRRKAFFAVFISFIIGMYMYKAFGQGPLLAALGGAGAHASPTLDFAVRHWYGVLYTSLVLGFGAWILSRPRNRHYRLHNYVRWRTISCMFFQTVFLFALPLIPARYLGGKAAMLITVWPLSLMPAKFVHQSAVLGAARPEIVFYAIFTALLAFVGMPLFVSFHGKRYCSWICGCGALAETFGEPWRRLAPKGFLNRRRERIIYIVLAASVFMSGVLVLREVVFSKESAASISFWYNLIVYTLFSGIVGVGMYPFLGSRMWCRYLCPLAAYMNLLGAVWSRYRISSNDRCIDCAQCNRYCEMGIDIKGFALQQKPLSVRNTPCIGCGECIAVCPMNVLKFGDWTEKDLRELQSEKT